MHIDVGIRHINAFHADFTPILTFPHQGGRDKIPHFNKCKQYRIKGIGLGIIHSLTLSSRERGHIVPGLKAEWARC